MTQKVHTMHGRDHMPGGADPLDWEALGINSALPGFDNILAALGADHLWKFDEAAGLVASDGIGANPLTAAGGTVTWGQPAAPPGTASVHSASARWQAAAGIPPLSNNFSAGLWLRNHNPGSTQCVLGQGLPLRGLGGIAAGWQISTGASGSKPGVHLQAGSFGTVPAAVNLGTDIWTLLGFSVAANSWQVYVNGMPSGAPLSFVGSTYSAASTWMGQDGGSGILYYDGLWSWAFLFQTHPLTDAEWLQIYNGSFPFAPDAQVLTSDGAGSTSWRTIAGAGGVTVSHDASQIVITGGGAAGPGNTYVFTQGSALATWTVAHGLSCFPSVTVVDSGGSEVIPTIVYVDANTVQLTFGSATSGKAYLN